MDTNNSELLTRRSIFAGLADQMGVKIEPPRDCLTSMVICFVLLLLTRRSIFAGLADQMGDVKIEPPRDSLMGPSISIGFGLLDAEFSPFGRYESPHCNNKILGFDAPGHQFADVRPQIT